MKTVLAMQLLSVLPVYAAVANWDISNVTADEILDEVERVSSTVDFEIYECEGQEYVPEEMLEEAKNEPNLLKAQVVLKLAENLPVGGDMGLTYKLTDDAHHVANRLIFSEHLEDETTLQQDVEALTGASTDEYFKCKKRLGGINPILFVLMLEGNSKVVTLAILAAAATGVMEITSAEFDRVMGAYLEQQERDNLVISLIKYNTGVNPLAPQVAHLKELIIK
tara:strand:- start:2664 stop:3332 length:669 start_codon:yes stop_codon:yes gene_type:complete